MDIEFGEIQESLPQVGLPPDQDGRFAVRRIGQLNPDDLRIFVDLDIMRDMEAHAHSNRRVELGGVLLGKQQIDGNGRPFVYVFEALRAEHYEATKGSFKFTHETWSQITRDRAKFHPDLEMVGWYHTHPGWTVFLSDMDLFICNHFFNRPQDVALVIDPCHDDRGWFQWIDAPNQPLPDPTAGSPPQPLTSAARADSGSPTAQPSRKKTQRTGGFLLVSNRLRQQELDYFAAIYNKQPSMNPEPRHAPAQPSPVTPMIQIPTPRNPLLEFALLSSLLLQLALIGLISWKILSSPTPVENSSLSGEVSAINQKIDQLSIPVDRLNSSPRMQAYQEVLSRLVAAQTGDSQLADQFTELKVDHQQLEAQLKAQTWMARELEQRNQDLNSRLETQTAQNQRLSQQLQETRTELSQKDQQVEALKQTVQSLSAAPPLNFTGNNRAESRGLIDPAALDLPWWLAAGAGLGVLVLGCGFGFLLGRQNHRRSPADELDASRLPFQDPDLSRTRKGETSQEKS